MLNLLEDYIWRSLPEWAPLYTNHNLPQKVNDFGEFLPYHGNTVVFDLSSHTKLVLQDLQKELYLAAGWMLSEKLDPSIFHMTLHDLVNGPERTETLKVDMAAAEKQAKCLLSQWKDQPPLQMKATWIFNMVNASLVLGLKPENEDSRIRLENMYQALESVVPLGYPMCPHVTLAYFKPGVYTWYDVYSLREALHPVELDVTLDFASLFYQEFSDMNHYETK